MSKKEQATHAQKPLDGMKPQKRAQHYQKLANAALFHAGWIKGFREATREFKKLSSLIKK